MADLFFKGVPHHSLHPHTAFKCDTGFFEIFLVHQYPEETVSEYAQRFVNRCTDRYRDIWEKFFHPPSAQAVFFLVGLKNQGIAREVFARTDSTDCLPRVIGNLKAVLRSIKTVRYIQSSRGVRVDDSGLYDWWTNRVTGRDTKYLLELREQFDIARALSLIHI